ncbi:XdhC family protein [Ketobacter sp.]|uniref:XdhC family protein n=1 Tax=Ketobacter sp. TaxID=2083498 RepID=UPI000F2D16F6|nr:XdhC family protein [Ketobacter sp.]RLU00321.1 MAG: XdhC family protein [Ketobacter sp.]
MHSLDHQVLATLQDWVERRIPAWLCTIVATHGSSPRPAGSLMACNQLGQVVGSLSGGCVEDDLLNKLQSGDFSRYPRLETYGLSAEENARLGLPCGGYLSVLVEQIPDSALPDLVQINQALSQRRCIERKLDLATGNVQLKAAESIRPVQLDERHFVQVYGPGYTLLLVGAGQIAGCLAAMAGMMDYRVLVTDPRADKLDDFRLHILEPSSGCECILGMPDDVVRSRASDPFSIVITLTHDPRIDDMALMEALTLGNFYVGALGSARTTENRIERLRQLQLSEDHIARLHAPVGLAIGSKTAPEIAVAILAELTLIRRAREKAAASRIASLEA